jgi:hypothetical protein
MFGLLLIQGLVREQLPRLTLDFDSSVQSTKVRAQGSVIGFNKAKKGARSYYILFCSIDQTEKFFDVSHRTGIVHMFKMIYCITSMFCKKLHR